MTTKPRHIRIADVPATFAPSGRPCCRWCKKEILTGTRARRWCSQVCIDEYKIRANAAVARDRVEERDRGVCAGCGLNTGRVQRILDRLRSRAQAWCWLPNPWTDEALHKARLARAEVEIRKLFPGWRWGYHLWEADHIVPVAEGGGGCGLDNLRTLCRRCHGRESGQLRKRLNAARSPQATLPAVSR